MRRLVVSNIVSLDGYYEGPGGDVMVLPMDASFDEYNAERLWAADLVLGGRSTHVGFSRFWPAVAADPSQRAVEREIGRLQGELPHVVVSDTIEPADSGPWRDSTEIVRRADAQARIAALKHGGDRDILVFGSRTLWTDLLAAGLVDELHLMIGAVVLGGGTPLFDAPPPAPLRLIDTRRAAGSDNVLVRYRVG